MDDLDEHELIFVGTVEAVGGPPRRWSGSLEAYLSVVSNRLNEIMKVLTIFSAIMLPLTFIAGVYGMNFENMPELHSRYGYFATLLIMVVVAIAMLFFFWRRGWLGNRPPEVTPEE